MTSDQPHLKIECFPLGDFQTNCYLVHAGGKECWIIDAGYQPGPMIERIDEIGLEPAKLLLTHAHMDHIGGISEVRSQWPELPICLHEAEHAFLADPMQNLSAFIGMDLVAPEANETLSHGQTLSLGGFDFEVRHVPGHSPGSVAFYQAGEGVAIVGDTLMQGTVGRTDFPHSEPDALYKSIREQLYSLPDDTIVYSGHTPETTVGHEKRTNPFVRAV